MPITTQRARGMSTKADTRVFPSRIHFHVLCRYVERNARRVELVERAEDWRWVLCIARFCRVNPHHGCCPIGRCPVRPTGFTVSTNRWATKNSMWLARRSGGAVPSGKRTGSSRLPVDWTSNRRNGHADAPKEANLNRETNTDNGTGVIFRYSPLTIFFPAF